MAGNILKHIKVFNIEVSIHTDVTILSESCKIFLNHIFSLQFGRMNVNISGNIDPSIIISPNTSCKILYKTLMVK